MRIAVVGAGGLGGYVGGKLARAGFEVTFVARGERLRALRERGLNVRSAHGDFHVAVKVTDVATSVGEVDLLLFLVKTYDNEAAVQLARPLVGEHTTILSLQNGVDNVERVRQIVGRGRALGGVMYVESAMPEPGLVVQPSATERIVVGELDEGAAPFVERVVATLRRAELNAEASSGVRVEMWTKFAFICAFSGWTTLTRQPIGRMRDVAETRSLYEATIREVERVGRAMGVPLPEELVPRLMRQTDGFEATAKSSMLRDAEAERPLEIEALNGRVARYGRERGIPTPLNDLIYAALLPAHRGARP